MVAHKLKILYPVVVADTVDVVDMFAAVEWSAETASQYQAVLLDECSAADHVGHREERVILEDPLYDVAVPDLVTSALPVRAF